MDLSNLSILFSSLSDIQPFVQRKSVSFRGSKDSYKKSEDRIRFPKDAKCYIDKKLPQTNDEANFKYLTGAYSILCRENQSSEYFKALIDFISANNLSADVIFELPETGEINPCMADDLDLIKDRKRNYIPTFQNNGEAIDFANTGDVFQTPDSEFLKIKTDDKTVKELKIGYETYLKLFPPIERFMVTQGFSSDCHLLSVLDSALCTPKARYKILSSFKEEENGVSVKFPKGRAEIFFENGIIEDKADTIRLSEGCLGIKMLEYLYGYEILEERKRDGKEIKSLEEINETLPKGYPPYKNTADFYRENESNITDIFQMLGFSSTSNLRTRIPIHNIETGKILNEAKDDRIIIGASLYDWNLENGDTIRGKHAYRIEPVKTPDGQTECHIINASNSAFYSKMSVNDVLRIFGFIYTADV